MFVLHLSILLSSLFFSLEYVPVQKAPQICAIVTYERKGRGWGLLLRYSYKTFHFWVQMCSASGDGSALWKPGLNQTRRCQGKLVPQSIDFTPQKALGQLWMCLPAHPSAGATVHLAHLYVMFPSTGAKLFSLLDILL